MTEAHHITCDRIKLLMLIVLCACLALGFL